LVREILRLSPDPLDELGIEFSAIDPHRYRESWTKLSQAALAGRVPDDVIVYVHVPFCARLCSYCLLAAHPAPARRRIADYVSALRREISAHEPLLKGVAISSLHIGGGTPTLLSAAELDAVLGDLVRSFERKPGFAIGIEGHPVTTTPDKVEVLARHGVGRISIGVESFTRKVLDNVNRGDQTEARVAAAVQAARRFGLRVNLDLLAGLPGETLASFESSMRSALALCPDSLSVNRWVAEKSGLAATGIVPDAEDGLLAGEMLRVADRLVRELRPPTEPTQAPTVAGFGAQYAWEPTTTGYFQQDMIGPASILALGHGGLGHVYAGYFYTFAGTPDDWTACIQAGRPPPVLAAPVSRRFELAFAVAERACRGIFDPGELSRSQGADPREVFADELAFLLQEGLLASSQSRWSKPARRDFEVTHLLLFLLGEDQKLMARASRLRDAARPMSAVLRQYREIDAELPPSVLWCRIAMRGDARSRALVETVAERR